MRRRDSNTSKRTTTPNVGGGRMRERCEREEKMARGILEGFEGGRQAEKFKIARAECRWIAAMSLDQTKLLPATRT